MKIITYVAVEVEDAPRIHRGLARILHTDGSFHPVLFPASTPEAAAEKAQAWWDAELTRAAAKMQPRKPRAPKLQPQSTDDDIGDVL